MIPTPRVRRWVADLAIQGALLPYAGLLILVLAAPFERIEPALEFQVQQFTGLELVILAVLALWGIYLLITGERPQVKSALTVPALLLIGAMVVSALLAPDHQAEALRFTARFVAGFLVYLLVLNSVVSWRRLLGMLIAVGLTGTVVAILGILDHRQVPAVLEFLRSFRHGQIMVGGEVRASSTLQYPTITSMYLEIVFGLALGLLLFLASRHRWWLATLVFLIVALIADAIILTLSRSGLIVMAGILALAGGLWLLRRRLDSGLGAIAALGILIAGLLGRRLLSDSMLWLRLTTENDESWYRAQYQVPDQLELQAGQTRRIDVTVTNTGRVTWRPDGENPFRFAYHWLDADKQEVLIFEGLRTELPHPVRPGQNVQLSARVKAPPQPGRYYVAWDVLQEGRLWFSNKASPKAYSQAIVGGAATEEPAPMPTAVPATATEPNLTIDRRTLWTYAGQMLADRPLLGVGPDNFRLLYGRWAGLESWDQGLHTNNTYIEFFVDVGIIGGLLFLWLLWRVLKSLYQSWRTVDTADLPLFLGIAGALTAILLHGMVDYFFEFTSTYLMIWVTLGLVAALANFERGRRANRV